MAEDGGYGMQGSSSLFPHPATKAAFPLFEVLLLQMRAFPHVKMQALRGTWVAQLAKSLPSAQDTI